MELGKEFLKRVVVGGSEKARKLPQPAKEREVFCLLNSAGTKKLRPKPTDEL